MTEDKLKICGVVGARPNFMKIAPLMSVLQAEPEVFDFTLVHTGQHYDHQMNDVFFAELGIPPPAVHLGIGSGSHAGQTAGVMVAFEELMLQERPHLVVVVGDVNSTLAASLVAAKLNICLAHVEAGLRSFDRRMPEEVNRLVTDSLSDLLFTTSRLADRNLLAEGTDPGKIFLVGNIMIDTLIRYLELAAG
ncbi:MAG: UDP-N-acetylglucosamine 2-epimerase, partial [Candidatus Glassbacteria bacterium]|nr:UDP-N-acetylglucosamine 2-epimerase [Candidatus Glassbacteria bacterium]